LRRITRAMAMRWRWPPDSLDAALADLGVVAPALLPVDQIEDEVFRMGKPGGGKSPRRPLLSGRP